ncbi:cytochrome P450 [Amycolatopsis sp. NPDC059090]|uniref:cytochrome P450 n=1 Tax=Amycolatopsis sp. NPDC059090 TaxID=3346723 RepID=UPI00366DC620
MSEETLSSESPESQKTSAVPIMLERSCPYAPPDGYRQLAQGEVIRRLTIPGGPDGWIITRYDEARAMLTDSRFSAMRRVLNGRPMIHSESELDAIEGFFSMTAMDPPAHTRIRRLAARAFTAQRVRAMRPGIDEIVADQADELARRGSPTDLVAGFTLQLPQRVVYMLLGITEADQMRFPGMMLNETPNPEDAIRSIDTVMDYMAEIVKGKLGQPGGLIWELTHPVNDADALADDEISAMCAALVLAGHEDNVAVLTLGTVALLSHRDQWEAMADDHKLVPRAVEEILRYIAVFQFGINRRALEDVEFSGVTIRAGEEVYASVPAINFDPARMSDPDRFDIRRESIRHMTFGHGVHQCVAQLFARAILVSVFTELPRRFPTMRLAVPVGEISIYNGYFGGYGTQRLPVAWD